MALARLVSFDGISQDRVEEMKHQIDEGRPDEIPSSEIVMLYDAGEEKSFIPSTASRTRNAHPSLKPKEPDLK